jgi:hypothetical protein
MAVGGWQSEVLFESQWLSAKGYPLQFEVFH